VNLPVIIVGGGGHATVALEVLRCMSRDVVGYLSPVASKDGCGGIAFLGDDDEIRHYSSEKVCLVNGVGSVKSQNNRVKVFNKFKRLGYDFATVVHPSAVVASDVKLGEGCQVMAGVVLQPGVCCGENVVVNTKAGVDHHCSIGAHSHLSVGATLSGHVCVGERAHLGVGCIVIQGVTIGREAVVGAGSVVIRDVPDFLTVVGVPARGINR